MLELTGRVDYVKIIARVPVEAWDGWMRRFMACLPEEYRAMVDFFPKHAKVFNYYDKAIRQQYKGVEIWGQAADEWAKNATASLYANATRVDWRVEIPTPPIDPQELVHEIERKHGNSRRNVGYISSAARSKAGDRDAGGKMLFVGSHGSPRRLVVYKRGKEAWAIEVQFREKELKNVLSIANHFYHSENDVTFYDCLARALAQKHEDACDEMTGHGFAQWAHEAFWNVQEGAYNNQEGLLKLIDETMERLDPESKATVYETHFKGEGYVINSDNALDGRGILSDVLPDSDSVHCVDANVAESDKVQITRPIRLSSTERIHLVNEIAYHYPRLYQEYINGTMTDTELYLRYEAYKIDQ